MPAVSPYRHHANADMINCARCNTSNNETAQFCDECGASLASAGLAAPSLARAPQISVPQISVPQVSASPPSAAPPPQPSVSNAPSAAELQNSGRTIPFTLRSGVGAMPSATQFTSAALEDGEALDDEVTHVSAAPASERRVHAAGVAPLTSLASEEELRLASGEPISFGKSFAGATLEPRASSLKPPHARLVIERGRSAGKGFLINEAEIQIGRWDADGGIFPDVDLDADDPEAKVSRRHARIVRRADGYYIEDLGSTNGTFVNRGRRLLPGALHPLQDNDEIIVGKTFLRLHVIK